jgi:hypothetical protein
MGQQSQGVWSRFPKKLKAMLSRSYYAGPELANAVRVCQRLSRQGMSGTIGYWPSRDDTPRVVADAYIAGIDAVAAAGLNCSISIKAMVMDFNRKLITEITERAASAGVGIHYDSREIEFADPTFELVTAYA